MAKQPLLLECLLCQNKFSESDATNGLYFLATCICKECYLKGAKQDPKLWCFAKLQQGSSPGYSSENVACASLCPDRAICRQFIKRNKQKHKE